MKSAFTVLVVVFVLAVHFASGGEPAKEAVFKMPKDRDVFFRSYCYTGSSYVRFGRDGTYSRVQREHMFVEVIDIGTWRQAGTGEITLDSKKHSSPRDPETNPFHITPMTYRDVVFLLWKDAEMSMNRDLAGIKRAIDERPGKQRVAYAYVEIDRETFENESRRTQEFIFYPELNKRRRGHQ